MRAIAKMFAIWALVSTLSLGGMAARLHAQPEVKEQKKDLVASYCRNIRDAAAEARYRIQRQKLDELVKQVEEKTKLLEASIEKHQHWYRLRSEFTARATKKLVGIFAGMRAETAAAQLTKMPLEIASALILKLDNDAASAILNEMPAEHAAMLAGLISDAAGRPEQRGDKL